MNDYSGQLSSTPTTSDRDAPGSPAELAEFDTAMVSMDRSERNRLQRLIVIKDAVVATGVALFTGFSTRGFLGHHYLDIAFTLFCVIVAIQAIKEFQTSNLQWFYAMGPDGMRVVGDVEISRVNDSKQSTRLLRWSALDLPERIIREPNLRGTTLIVELRNSKSGKRFTRKLVIDQYETDERIDKFVRAIQSPIDAEPTRRIYR